MQKKLISLIRDAKPRRALFTTFTFSLSWFEALIVPVLRANGCEQIDVLIDAREACKSTDEATALHAGNAYRIIPVYMTGTTVFHPKLVYLEGMQEDTLVVSSANLTLAGHGKNLEVLDAVGSHKEPGVFAEFAQFLTILTEKHSFSAENLAVLHAYRDQAVRMKKKADPIDEVGRTAWLVHTLVEPAAIQFAEHALRLGAAHTLTVLSPYHAPSGRPVQDLADLIEVTDLRIGLCAKLQNQAPFREMNDFTQALGDLQRRGLPSARPFTNLNQVFELNSLELASTNEYTAGLELPLSTAGAQHDVFIYRQPKLTLLIPALALARGLFPLNSAAFKSIFSPRCLAELCIPFEKNGHWTVNLSSYVYKPKKSGVPLPMRESLTWASLYRSGEHAWNSVYANAQQGLMRIALPAVRVNALMHGIKVKNVVYVTSFKVAALLACDSPYEFAAGAPRSFLPHQGARSLYGQPNDYYAHRESNFSINQELLLSDEEWNSVASIFEKKSSKGGEQLISRRDLANAFLKRMVTGAPWTDSFYAPLAPKAGGKQLRVHRISGQLQEFVDVMQQLRPDATYLKIDEA